MRSSRVELRRSLNTDKRSRGNAVSVCGRPRRNQLFAPSPVFARDQNGGVCGSNLGGHERAPRAGLEKLPRSPRTIDALSIFFFAQRDVLVLESLAQPASAPRYRSLRHTKRANAFLVHLVAGSSGKETSDTSRLFPEKRASYSCGRPLKNLP